MNNALTRTTSRNKHHWAREVIVPQEINNFRLSSRPVEMRYTPLITPIFAIDSPTKRDFSCQGIFLEIKNICFNL